MPHVITELIDVTDLSQMQHGTEVAYARHGHQQPHLCTIDLKSEIIRVLNNLDDAPAPRVHRQAGYVCQEN